MQVLGGRDEAVHATLDRGREIVAEALTAITEEKESAVMFGKVSSGNHKTKMALEFLGEKSHERGYCVPIYHINAYLIDFEDGSHYL